MLFNLPLVLLLALELHKFEEEVGEIVGQAGQEAKMEVSLAKLDVTWAKVEWVQMRHKETDINTVKLGEEDFEALEDNQVQVQAMLANRYMKTFEEAITGWHKKLERVADVNQILSEIQRTWAYLESLFIHSDEVKKELPEAAARFKAIDGVVKTILKEACAVKNVVESANKDGLYKNLELQQKELEKEKMGQLESTEPAHLTISPPKFCRVSEKKLMEFPKRKLVEFGVCPEVNRIGGRFDVILHRLTPHDKAGADGENSDDEEWNPDKDGANEDANASAGASGRALNEFKGRGWGFELVRWRMDLGRVLRVGRVHPASPASRAGLLPNDIILSINGKAAATLTTEGALARELIATSYAKIDRPSGYHHIVDLLSKHKVLGGPIALQVLRVVPGIRRSSSQSRSLTPSHSHGSLTPPGARGSQERQQRMQQQEAATLADQQRAIQQQQEQIRREREQQQQQQQ